MASSENPAKRQKIDNGDDFQKVDPSPVVHVRGLNDNVFDEDLSEGLQQFGTISYIITLPGKRQALVEFEDLQSAIDLVKHARNNAVYISGRQALFNFSTSQKLKRSVQSGGGGVRYQASGGGGFDRAGGGDGFDRAGGSGGYGRASGGYDRAGSGRGSDFAGGAPNRVLLLTVLNPKYPITTDVIHTICSTHGQVLRIVIFRRRAVQSMVEFDSEDSARRAKAALDGADIYSGCCTLRIEFAKQTRLNVFKNNDDTWDYTGSFGGDLGGGDAKGGLALLDAPFGGFGGRRQGGPPPPGYGNGSFGYGGPPPQGRYGPPPPFGGGRPSSFNKGYDGGMGGIGDTEGCVLMVYGLNAEKMNCQKVFNIFCVYGNVARVKFLKSVDGAAMVQMGDRDGCERSISSLNGAELFGNKLQVMYSKQSNLQDRGARSYELLDKTPSFQDFVDSRCNRFTSAEALVKNRTLPPTKILHFYNSPPNIMEEQLLELFRTADVALPLKTKKFPPKGDKSSTGLLEWGTVTESLEALACVNHVEISSEGSKYPFTFKLSFSGAPIKDDLRPKIERSE